MIIITFLSILSGLIIRNIHLSRVLFYDWDEGMYAQIAQEIINNKSLFTTFNGHIWLDKPPLIHSLISLVFLIIGNSEFWARMLMVVGSFSLLILTYLLAKKISKKNTIASLLPVAVLAASPIFLERATLLNSDIFIAISWLGYFLFWDKYWAKLFFLTLGVWSKSVLGFYPLIFELVDWSIKYLVLRQQLKLNFKKIGQCFLFILIPSLWYIAGTIKFGWFFIENHFLSQVFKRLYVPIELHFGNKFFYFSYLWQNLGLINILFVLAYLLIVINFRRDFKKEKFSYLVFLVPLPFLALLTLMKTKITWYVIIFLPFLALLTTYLYVKIKPLAIRLVILIGIIIYFLVGFIPQTFFLKSNYFPPDKLKLAQCLSQAKGGTVGFLVDEEERKVKNFLEAAHYDTTSSFLYGGSPSFVYYVQKKIDYYYNIDDFIKNNGNYKIIALSKEDIEKNSRLQSVIAGQKTKCVYGQWVGIVK